MFLISCATLNKDECRSANWNLIGYEDGSKGYPAKRIGQHRKACAEYGVTPDLSQYKLGRAEGLHSYCIPATGFNLGKAGSNYNGVCAGYNEQQFITAYKQGAQLYLAISTLNKMKKQLSHKNSELDTLIAEIQNKEQQIINGGLSKSKIILLLVETKNLAIDQGVLMTEIHDLKAAIEQQEITISHLKQA